MMARQTVLKVVFCSTQRQVREHKAQLALAGIPYGRHWAVTGGWKFKQWHSGPKVNLA